MKIGAVLLAAGLSSRFGDRDKISAPLAGVALGLHAARTLGQVDLRGRFVVTGGADLDWPGFIEIPNRRPDEGLSHSLMLGVRAARETGLDAILVALADMPLVPASHFERLIAGGGHDSLVASSDGHHAMPPALFGREWFSALEGLEGDRGAGALLARADRVRADGDFLIDIDTPADLCRVEAALRDRSPARG